MRKDGLWQRLKRALGLAPPPEPPDEQPALVPSGPSRPLGSGAVALELPQEPEDTDARGRQA
jgi:hypothetical protein